LFDATYETGNHHFEKPRKDVNEKTATAKKLKRWLKINLGKRFLPSGQVV
jgi:hypothetical protein